MNSLMPPAIFLCRLRAFTLVEVTLALGVVSFGLLSLLGLLPMGLLLMRDAVSQTTCSHIVQKVRSDLSLLSPVDAEEYVRVPKSFDFQGKPAGSGGGPVAFVAMFQPEMLQYPGSDVLEGQNDAGRVVVTIVRARGEETTANGEHEVVLRTSVALARTR